MRWALAIAVVLALAGCTESDQARCDDLFAERIGRDINDNSFWNELQDCARDGLLPEGYNDPELYR